MKRVFFLIIGVLLLNTFCFAEDPPVEELETYSFEMFLGARWNQGTQYYPVPPSIYDDNEFSGGVGVYYGDPTYVVSAKGTFRVDGVQVFATTFHGNPGGSVDHDPYVGPVPEGADMTIGFLTNPRYEGFGTAIHHLKIVGDPKEPIPDPDPNQD